ncbi:putative bifunctional diguanylate cyclase/phosphodiesterase [Falsihalocynthiibacter sp. SS001]|uniref:putative bifunctional diguanylate cyclase/phosphodiesterase n=1 Tax=Falsihalocynthiibacter sp. SS001 TaxID=3349698 RepID=UPI0036D40AFB
MHARAKLSSTYDRLRRAISIQYLLAFLPAITLGAYWLGGEGALVAVALILPALLSISEGFSTPTLHTPHDGITRLPLRSAVENALDRSLDAHSRSGLTTASIQLDLDDFHAIAERYDHSAAEQILLQASDRLLGVLRSNDVMARLDGGRFAIAVTPARRADLETLIQMGGRIQESVAVPFLVGNTNIYLTASVGFCLSSRLATQTGAAMLDAAECALQEAKLNGPGGVRAYSPEMKRKIRSQSALQEEVRAALETGEIQPWFQPQISTHTGEVTGFEALARWQHPTRGIINPSDFLPAIEQAGLSERLSEVILFHSLSALKQWDKTDFYLPSVGVNFSSDELRNPKLVEKIQWELDRFDIAAGRLNIEILESVVSGTDDDTIARNIKGLSQLGCGIDLDDFGTGHAAIANIRRFSVSRIKVDRSFVTKIDLDPEQNRMVSAILTMAERLELDTLAEGVESVGEHATLSQLGCGHVQGFGIGRPMPFSETVTWIEKHRTKIVQTPTISRKQG